MNCANHPDVAGCGLLSELRQAPVLRLHAFRRGRGLLRTVPGRPPLRPAAAGCRRRILTGLHAHPVLAGLLGFIPGVGAMYNGQFVKALAHVLIFAVFVSLSDKSFVFAMLVAAWTFYQVFDAAQTAKARRDGLPLPNPFGLNDLGTRLGMTPRPPPRPTSPALAPTRRPVTPPGRRRRIPFGPVAIPAQTASGAVPPPSGYTAPYAAPSAAAYPNPGSPLYP